MMCRHRLTTTQRRKLYESAESAARAAGREHPACNLCPHPILPGQAWDVSHEGVPAALGGTVIAVAHKRCNRIHGAQIVTPMVAKAKRTGDKFRDIKRTRNPLPGGKSDPRKRTMAGEVVDRETGERWGARSGERCPDDRNPASPSAVSPETNPAHVQHSTTE
jgi:hypothetical protein